MKCLFWIKVNSVVWVIMDVIIFLLIKKIFILVHKEKTTEKVQMQTQRQWNKPTNHFKRGPHPTILLIDAIRLRIFSELNKLGSKIQSNFLQLIIYILLTCIICYKLKWSNSCITKCLLWYDFGVFLIFFL